MLIFSYSDNGENSGLLVKTGLDKPQVQVDFSAGMAGGVTLGAVTYGALTIANTDTTSTVISGVSTSGPVLTLNLLTAGTSGTQAAIDGSRFKIYVRPTLSNSRDLEYDIYLYIQAPTYGPT